MSTIHKHKFQWYGTVDKNDKLKSKEIGCGICGKLLDDIIFEMQTITGAFT